MSEFTLESVREWSLHGVNLPVFLGKPGQQPLIPVQESMQLIYESKNNKENVRRFGSFWWDQLKDVHQCMWKGFPVPETFRSFKDWSAKSSEKASLLNKSAMPLSVFISLLVAASQRKMDRWALKPSLALATIIDEVCDMGTEQLVWHRVGDNLPVTIPLVQPVVDPTSLWTYEALVSWIIPLFQDVDHHWAEDFSFDTPSLSSVILMCLDPVVFKRQPLLRLRAYSAMAFIAHGFAKMLQQLSEPRQMPKYCLWQRRGVEDTAESFFNTQRKVRSREVLGL